MNIKKFVMTLIILLGLFVAIIAGIYVSSIFTFSDSVIVHSDEVEPVTGDMVNILVMGLDSNGDRSDVMMLAMLNDKTNQLTLVSIPRDTKVVYKNRTMRANEAHHHDGTDGAIRAIRDLTGQPIHYYASMTFEGFRKTIDALGGVEYTLARDYDYDDPYQDLHIHLKEGKQVLDGAAAEGLVRFRNDYKMGDIDRIAVQQDFFRELVKQKLNAKYLLMFPSIAKEVSKHVKTNMQISTMMGYMPFVRSLDAEDVHTVTLPGHTVDGSPYWYADKGRVEKLMEQIEEGTIDVTPAPTPAP